MLPKDPFILLSLLNTELRDFYDSLQDLCLTKNYDIDEIISALEKYNYFYDSKSNQFK
jgi:hypothetical protein